MYLVPCQSGIIALSVAFHVHFISFYMKFAIVYPKLCHVLCDEAKSPLCHFFVFIVEIVMKVSNNETVLLLKKIHYDDNSERNHGSII